MKTIQHILDFSFKNTAVLSSTLKTGLSIVVLFVLMITPSMVFGAATASSNYASQTGNIGTTYSWIDCSDEESIISGDDQQASISWPFDFTFYDNTYTTSNSLSICTNGFIRLDGTASTSYQSASAFSLSGNSTELGQIVAIAVQDGNISGTGWIKSKVTGASPNRILTVEYNHLEVDYNDGKYTDVQVSFYETSNIIVLKLGDDNITKTGVDMGIHSGVSGFSDNWQEISSGSNNTWIEYTSSSLPPISGPQASWNYDTQTGTTGSTYSWIDCSSGSSIVSGDDEEGQISWPFNFSYYDNDYTTSDQLSVTTNGFIRLDETATTNYTSATAYDLTSTATNLGQIIAMGVYDAKVGDNNGWVKYLVTGEAPNQILTIEYNNLEIDYNDKKYGDVQVSFYESTNKIVLKLGSKNTNKSGADIGLHSGVATFYNKWQEVKSGTSTTWIEYSPKNIEISATVGASAAYYPTLKDAFDKVNDGTYQGNVTVKINHSTTETTSAVLNASGSGSANYTSLTMYPTMSGVAISGNVPKPLIDLNGADNVIIDGRVNASGSTKALSIINSSIKSYGSNSAIRFINDASNNIIRYCTIKNSETLNASGVIYFSTTTGSTGNDNNLIDNNNLTTAIATERPKKVIYSKGSSGKDNSNNIISNNNFYDFLRHQSSPASGILLEDNTTEWTIDGNSFYETTSFSPTVSISFDVIKISNTSGNGFIISNNYIGGSAPQCGGTAWSKNPTMQNLFNAITLKVGTTQATSVQNNTIQNIDWSDSWHSTWTAINVTEGNVDIGTVTGNTIGATTGTNSIKITGEVNNQIVYGIKLAGTGLINCNNNSIGSITSFTASTLAANIYAIEVSGSPSVHIENNSIGSPTTANSILASSASTGNTQKVYGIYAKSTGTTVIHGNTLSNISNAAVSTRGYIYGVYLTAGTNTVDNNIIRDISINNTNSSSSTPSIVGLYLNTKSEAQSIYHNQIYNLSNTSSSFTGCVMGIFAKNYNGATASSINANFIHSLSVDGATTGTEIYGIFESTDAVVYSNNIISLGGNTSSELFGLYDGGASGNTASFFFNSIYISGTNSGSEKSYALRYNTKNNTRDLRNNVLVNTRSGASGSHYAIRYDNIDGTFTAENNDYYVTGTGGILAYYGGNKNTLVDLQSATSQDANSLNLNPSFTTPGGTSSSDYITTASLPAVAGTGITTDYNGVARANLPKMGALEFTLGYIWQGGTSTDFGNASNWINGEVPLDGSDISFATSPTHDCSLDQNRTLNNITNISSKKLILNSKQLTVTGDIVSPTANQIDATSALSRIVFAGGTMQTISSEMLVSNTVDGLELNNTNGLTQDGDIIISNAFILTDGAFTIGDNTLTLNGNISTTSGTLNGGNTSNIIIEGSGAATTLPSISVNNLTLNRGNGISLSGDLTINGILALPSGTLTIGANTLTIAGTSPTRVKGNINPNHTSSLVVLSNSSPITCPSGLFTSSLNNVTINGGGGINPCCSCTINGTLSLESANPSSTQGLLHMGTDTLNMGPNATTVGIGDVTGIIKREHAFTPNAEYSFGSEYTTFTFVDSEVKPTWICVKISIGTVPEWTPWAENPNGKVKRLYQVSASDNSSTAQANINMRYLPSELDASYNDESKLSFWHKFSEYEVKVPHEHGKSNQDLTHHYLGITGLTFGNAANTKLDSSSVAIAYSVLTKNTWKGGVADHQTEWEQANNWTSGTVPTSTENVLIPEGLNYYPSLTASANAVAKSIEIESGASITANTYDITVSGSTGAWINHGTLNPGTGTVIFNHNVLNEIVTIAGTTNFYNIEVGVNTTMQPVTGATTRIAGAGIADLTSVVDFSTVDNTVEWNGADQTIVNPNGISGNDGYYRLILSGSGTKTMPTTAITITEELKVSGTASVTAASALTIGNNFEILENATFSTGNFDHTIGGAFDNSGIFTASAGSKITMNGATEQEIYGTSATTFEKLTINNSAGVNIATNVIVNDALTLTNGTLEVGSTTLTINGELTKTAGVINTNLNSSITIGGTSPLTFTNDLFEATPLIDTLTINRSGGVIWESDLTVNGVLNLEGANPSSGVIGSLDMSTNTLTMGAAATTMGIGDVTGMVKRTTILADIEYTFGNQFTSATFPNIGTLPTEMTVKISIGSAPSWNPDAVKRSYDLIHVGGSDTRATLKGHYLDSELNGNAENELIDVNYITSLDLLVEQGRSDISTTENWVVLSNLDFSKLHSTFGEMELSFAESMTDIITWNGSISTDWDEASNWTPAFSPDTTKVTIIPDASTTERDPLLPVNDSIYSLLIHANGILNSRDTSELTVVGSGGAWENNGTFNASTGKVIFKHNDISNIVTVAGETNFYNIEAGENTTLQPVAGTILRIAGVGSAYASSIVDFSSVENTVEWNGTDQIIKNPNGIAGNAGYYNLILSGSGTKTMPASAMTINGNLTTSGTVTATAADSLVIIGDLSIGAGSTLGTGRYIHTIAGDFENNGTLNTATNGNIIFNGTTVQSINGTSTTDFDKLTIENAEGVSQYSNININNTLDLNDGSLTVANTTLGINGIINNPSGKINISDVSSLSFGGTSHITLNNNLFNDNPTLNNLTINRSGGVTLGNESMTVEGTLALTDGTLTIAANTLTLNGNSISRTGGNIDASNDSATLVFNNASAMTLPSSIFSTNINNLTISGAGGVTAGHDFSIDGILNLQSANPSATKGSLDMAAFTLNMGVNATTTGMGDVTGIVRREHAFGNGIEYSFGNQYTSLNFLNVPGNSKPTWISCKIEIGTAPSWRSEAINRNYSFAQSGGNDRMIVKLHYIDSELHGTETDETQLVFWDAYNPDLVTANDFTHHFPRNHNGTNTNNNWVQLTGPAINYLATSSTLDVKQWGLGYTNVSTHKWIGLGSPSYPGDWSLPGHWEGGVPQAGDSVLIPASLPIGNSGYPYQNLLPVIAPATAGFIEIEAGSILTSDGYDITVTGFGNAWINNGLFSAGSGTVIFHHSDDSEIVNLTGSTNFNNLTINDKTYIQGAANSSLKISGIFNAIDGSILDFTSYENTIEYNGASSQNIINPTGISTSGYHHLILSGEGTKTLPSSVVNIKGDLTVNAVTSATENTLIMNGATAQNISGFVALSLDNCTISNATETVTTGVDINCSGAFTNTGILDMTSAKLGITGTIDNTGTIKTSSTHTTPIPSSKTWGGTVQYKSITGGQTLVGGTYNNLTISNSSGIQLTRGNVTVNAALTTTAGGTTDMGVYQLLGTISSLNNAGTILTQNTSTTPIPTNKTWGGTVKYNATTGGQTVMAGTYNTLSLGNSSGTQAASGAIVATTLNSTAGGTLSMTSYALSGLTTVSNLGTLRTQNTSSAPFTSGLTWDGTVIFDGILPQTLPNSTSTFNNLTISNEAGVTAADNQNVNGKLNLSVANPDNTHGSLDMSMDTLHLGANATTTGIGDVTGIVNRTSFIVNTTYTYGNKNQYIIFPEVVGQTLPTSFTMRLTLLATAPDWATNATKRIYEFSQKGGANTKGTLRANYLDSELASGAQESLLSFWQNIFPFGNENVLERGWSDYNIEENWITFSDANLGNIPNGLDSFKIVIAPTQVEYRTWNGSQNTTDWNTVTNWTPQGLPTSSLGIIIPHLDNSNHYSPDLPTDAIGKYIIIQEGGILNTVKNAVITLMGNGNVWSIEEGGSFNADTSNVLLAGGTSSGVVRISGSTDFHDLTISDSTTLRPGLDSYIGIKNSINNNGILDAAANHNIIEFKKDGDLTIVDPNGETPGFHSLIISGTGTKTLPSALSIWHDFTNNGTVAAGTGKVTFNGIHSGQIIGGSSTTNFYDLEIANTGWEITTEADITVSNTLTINSNATLNPGPTHTIGGTGTLNGSGTAKVTRIITTPDMASQYPISTKALSDLSVDYCGTGDQTISAHDYGDLLFSANGTRIGTLTTTGIIRVSNILDLDLSTTTYIITGSTFEANGTGAQTVPTFNYNNIIVSGDRGGATITLVNGGTIGIAGDGVVSATNANYEIINNTIDINGDGDQNLDKFSFYHLKISNSGTKTALDTLTVYGNFTIDEGLTLDMSDFPLSGSISNINNSGTLKTSNTSTAPLPNGKTWNGTVEYAGSSAQTVATGTYQNLTMSGAGGGTTIGDITINGELNLSHANTSTTQGILHTNTYTLHMGATATTLGDGDVTGIVKREHTFANGVEYTFGNIYTNLNFLNVPGNTKPDWISCKIGIGTAPTWRDSAINRIYSFAQSGGNDRMIVKLHYLDNELHNSVTDESQLVFWDAYNPDLVTPDSFVHYFPRNNNGNNTTNNWVQLTGPAINYLATSSILDVKQWGLAYTNVDTITWIGLGSPSYPGDWSLPGHWNGGVPKSDDDVLITTLPENSAGYPYRNLLPEIAPSMVKTLEIGTNGTFTLNDFDITISGDTNAWVNNGTFNAGTNAVIFNNGNPSKATTLSGNTNFYDITVGDNTKIQPATNSVLGIAGTLSLGSGSLLDFSSNENTVIYNGNENQNILTANGGTMPGYDHLILNSSGEKSWPTDLTILGNLTINAPIATSGNTTVMSGTTSQTISGTYPTTFDNLTINNTTGVTLDMDELCTVRGTLLINSGKKLQVSEDQQLTVSGTIDNNSGATGFILHSTDISTASLIHETDNVAVTVERNITGESEDWHFLSTPVIGQEISPETPTTPSWVPSGTYGNNTGYDMYLWNEPGNCWIYKLNETWSTLNSGANFAVGRGYLYSVQATNPTKEFVGDLNNGSITYGLNNEGLEDVNLQGFNLVGNPYPSSIDWMATSGWSRDNLVTNVSNGGKDMWIWNPEAGNYGVCNSATGDGTNAVTRYIAPMQGFFVRAESAGNMVSTNDVRTHDATTVWKSAQIVPSRITAVVHSDNDQTSDEVRILFGYPENNVGTAKLFSPLVTAPSLYLPDGGASFSIRYLSDTISNPNLPLAFKAGSNGNYSISFDFNTSDFEVVILEDKQTKKFIDLTTVSVYHFEASQTDNEKRFTLHFGAIKPEAGADLPARIYAEGINLMINLLLVKEETNITVCDAMGRLLLRDQLAGKTQYQFPFDDNNHILIVYLENAKGHLSEKVVLQK